MALSWVQADQISDSGHQWIKDRLGLIVDPDGDGMSYVPR